MNILVAVLLILGGLTCGWLVLRHVWRGMVGAEQPPTATELAQQRQEAAALGFAASTPQIHPVRLGRRAVIRRNDERKLEKRDEEPQ